MALMWWGRVGGVSAPLGAGLLIGAAVGSLSHVPTDDPFAVPDSIKVLVLGAIVLCLVGVGVLTLVRKFAPRNAHRRDEELIVALTGQSEWRGTLTQLVERINAETAAYTLRLQESHRVLTEAVSRVDDNIDETRHTVRDLLSPIALNGEMVAKSMDRLESGLNELLRR